MKARLFPDELLRELAAAHGTPLYVYDLDAVVRRLDELAAFDVVRYAQKANSNLALLACLREAGALVDAVSAGEVIRALRAGFGPEDIVFTADLFDRATLAVLREHPVGINVGSPDMLAEVAALRPGGPVTLRINPGFGDGHHPSVHSGGEASKHGVWHADLDAVVREAEELGLVVTGLHLHIGSGADLTHLERTAEAMRTYARRVPETLRSISTGGGLPVPYRLDEPAVDVARYTEVWTRVRSELAAELGRPITLETEPGRYLVAEAGLLLTEVRGRKRSGALDYVLVDAGFHTLVRPAMYGAYHHISALSRDGARTSPRIVAGPLCEPSDIFTQDANHRPVPVPLPDVRPGELLCIHDAGAYCASMASGYNSQPLPAEVVVEGGTPRLARRRQDLEELASSEVETS